MENEPQERRGWFKRNWLWFVPTVGCGGCLGTIGIAVVAIGLFAATAVKQSDAYRGAIARAQQSAPLAEALGTPISPGFFAQGNVRINGQSGSATLTIPLSGPRGKATLTVLAYKSGGTWRFAKLDALIAATGQHIDLGGDPTASEPEGLPSPEPSDSASDDSSW